MGMTTLVLSLAICGIVIVALALIFRRKPDPQQPIQQAQVSVEEDADMVQLRADAAQSIKELQHASVELSNARREYRTWQKQQEAARLRGQTYGQP
ncbi:MAG: hypothetical protein FJZ05_01040 [Candidatus Nealsonbacteria bacterium]|nr:hypothetical protein [Candidatus Nealsonbacteria bacterium]